MLSSEKRRRIVKAIAALPTDSDEIAVYAPRVLAIFADCTPHEFMEIDDQIGNARPEFEGKGWMVRRVRNDVVWGRKLFDSLATKKRHA